MFCIYQDVMGPQPLAVRVSSNGNLVDAGNYDGPSGSIMFGRYGAEATWPVVYPTADAAWAAIAAASDKCRHKWHVHSHEEKRCSRCGEVVFVPDLD